MLGALVAVVMKEQWSLGSDQSSHPHVLIGQLSRFDLETRSFSVMGLSEVDVEIDQCAALRRMSDSADLLPELRGAPPQPVRDNENDTFIIVSVRPRFYAFACQLRARVPQDDVIVVRRNDGRRERYRVSKCLAIEYFDDGVQVDICTEFEVTRHRVEEAARQQARRQAESAVRAAEARAHAEHSWLKYEYQLRADAEERARVAEERRRVERMNSPELREARTRLDQLLAEYRVREMETTVESSLRQAVSAGQTVCVALTDAERAEIRHAAVAKLVHQPRTWCWSRRAYPGLDVGDFTFGVAPQDRQQYLVRYAGPPAEHNAPHVVRERGAGGGACGEYTLHKPPRSERASFMWPDDITVPPPGYPVTTMYEKRLRNCTSPAELGRTFGLIQRKRGFAHRAEMDSLHRQKFWAKQSRGYASSSRLFR